MEFHIEKYLSESRLREIAEEEFRAHVRDRAEDYFQRVVTNGCYHSVERLVDDALGGKLDQLITEKTTKVINELSSYTVFDGDGDFRGSKPYGRQLIIKALDENRDLIKERIAKFIKDLSDHDALRVLEAEYPAKQEA